MEQKKRGPKPGTKYTEERRLSIMGEKNHNYKHDRSQIKVGVACFSLTADIKDWLEAQPNKSQYILTLIREDMKKQTK